jgi:hypothetical protein
LQFGGVYLFGYKPQTTNNYPNGVFAFSGVHTGDPAADYLLGLDATYSQNNNQNLGTTRFHQTEFYVQDDWKAAPHLTVTAGIRWVIFSPDTVDGNQVTNFAPSTFDPTQAPAVSPGGTLAVNASGVPETGTGTTANLSNGLVVANTNGVPPGFYKSKFDNIGPRIGFAYTLPSGKSAIHGGYGIGYSRLPISQLFAAYGTNPPFNKNANISNSLLSDGVAGVGTPAQVFSPQTLNAIITNFKASQIQSYSLTVEQQVSGNLVASIAYVGSVARHLQVDDYDQNFASPVTVPSAAGCLPASQAPSGQYQFDPCINTGKTSVNYTRPYPGYAAISTQAFPGSSDYNALQTGVIYKTTPLQINIAYTWSKTLATIGSHTAGNGQSVGGPSAQNWRNIGAEYGPPSYDRRNVFAGSIVYDLPFFLRGGNPVVRQVFGHWSVAGLTIMESGYPLSPSLGTSTPGLAIRPNLISPINKIGKKSEWFTTSSFAAPAYGFFGNASNGSIQGPSEFVVHTALYKAFPLPEGINLQFRAEAFNVANHPNFANLSTALGTPTFGQATSAQDPRILEFALRLSF